MRYNDLAKLLIKAGWHFEREGKGSHKIWKHPEKPLPLSIPYHGSDDLKKGLLNKLLKQAGIK